jgi:protein SCO1
VVAGQEPVGRGLGVPGRLRLVGWALIPVAAAAAALALVLATRGGGHPAITSAAPPIGGPALTWAAGARIAPDFSLIDQNGRPVSLARFRGRPVILTFIDPLCRNLCPIEARVLNNVVRKMPAESRPAIVAVSVDVYGNAHADLVQDRGKWQLVPQWYWAIGKPAKLDRVWKNYGVEVQDVTKTIAGITVHNIVHTEAAYVVDAKGDQRALFLWPFDVQDLQTELGKLARAT